MRGYNLVCLSKNNELLNDSVQYFLETKVKLIKYHKQFAEDLGINDLVVEKYDIEKAKETWLKSNRDGYVVEWYDKYIGMIECEILDSEEEIGLKTLYIHKIYIEPEYQHHGILKQILKDFRERYSDMAIELSCWYNLPAHEVYQALGFKRMSSEYILLPSDEIK